MLRIFIVHFDICKVMWYAGESLKDTDLNEGTFIDLVNMSLQ